LEQILASLKSILSDKGEGMLANTLPFVALHHNNYQHALRGS
jgi:hypothetical protein